MATAVRRSMARHISSLLLLAGSLTACLDENLIKQPELSIVPGTPAGWTGSAETSAIGTTVTDKKTGTRAAYLSNAFQTQIRSFFIQQSIRAENYRGKRVRLSGWIRPRNVSSATASGLFMRIDGPGLTLASDNMARRPVTGYGDWRSVSVVLDVPTNAIGIVFGVTFQAVNTILIDDLKLEVVGTDVASTNTLTVPIANGVDSITATANFARRAATPSNMDFEGLTSLGTEGATWLTQNSSALSSTGPTTSLDELEPLRAMVGTTHVVGLGESANGVKEFAQLKDRVVRFLVSRMGFTAIAIDASVAEADDLNEYLRTGVGDPARLLAHLYVPTLNTRETLDMLAWIRQWNASASAAQQVQFRGLDMLYPSASIDSVKAFIHRVAPNYDADFTAIYACLTPFRNNGNVAGRPRSEYASQSTEIKTLCAEALANGVNLVRTLGASNASYQRALHYARVVQQFETVASFGASASNVSARDNAMAENVAWIRDQSQADTRVIVLSHNDRITRQPGSLGAYIETRYPNDYRSLALFFGTGAFNALISEGATQTLRAQSVEYVPAGSLEDAFLATNTAVLLFDARKTLDGSTTGNALRGPILMRSVGSTFVPATESLFFLNRLLPNDYELMLFLKTATASALLPYVN